MRGVGAAQILTPALWDLKPEASTKAVADPHFQVPPNAGGSNMSLGMSLHQGSSGPCM